MSVNDCRTWVENVVVGDMLCPWAAAPLRAGRVRFQESRATDTHEVLAELVFEARLLLEEGGPETTLLVLLPERFPVSFEELLDLVDIADNLFDDMPADETDSLGDAVQLVAFHPEFAYADSEADDPANGTNQSPVPMVHLLLREQVEATGADGEAIALRNATFLREKAAAACPHAKRP